MEKEIKMVEDFHNAFGHPVHTEPKMLSAARSTFRHTLLQEEVTELLKASMRGDVVEVADGIADCLYILFGTAHEFGLGDKLPAIFAEVHASNMSKLVDGKPLLREDGKVMKPEGYRPPNLKDLVWG